jgi:hypothetical protein
VLDGVGPPSEREGAAERVSEGASEARAVGGPLADAEGAGASEPLPRTDAVGDGEAVPLCEGGAEREPAAEALGSPLDASVALPLAQGGGVPVRVRSTEALGLSPGCEGVRGALAHPLCEPRGVPVPAGDWLRRPLTDAEPDKEGCTLREEKGLLESDGARDALPEALPLRDGATPLAVAAAVAQKEPLAAPVADTAALSLCNAEGEPVLDAEPVCEREPLRDGPKLPLAEAEALCDVLGAGEPVGAPLVGEFRADKDGATLREALAHELALGGAEEEADAEGGAERSALALAQPEADDGGVALLFAVAGGESEAAPDSVALPLPQTERLPPPPGLLLPPPLPLARGDSEEDGEGEAERVAGRLPDTAPLSLPLLLGAATLRVGDGGVVSLLVCEPLLDGVGEAVPPPLEAEGEGELVPAAALGEPEGDAAPELEMDAEGDFVRRPEALPEGLRGGLREGKGEREGVTEGEGAPEPLGEALSRRLPEGEVLPRALKEASPADGVPLPLARAPVREAAPLPLAPLSLGEALPLGEADCGGLTLALPLPLRDEVGTCDAVAW